jgi:HSP20 family protein
MAVMRWDPLSELEDMSEKLDQVMRARRVGTLDDWMMQGMARADWIPTVDVSENETEFTVQAELPGVTRKDLKVTVENGVLTIEGERKHERNDRGQAHHRVERVYGRFVRSFTLPPRADDRRARGEYADGILRLHIPKIEASKPRRIEVMSPGRSIGVADGSSQGDAFVGPEGWARLLNPIRRAWAQLGHRLSAITRH